MRIIYYNEMPFNVSSLQLHRALFFVNVLLELELLAKLV